MPALGQMRQADTAEEMEDPLPSGHQAEGVHLSDEGMEV